MKIRHLWYLLLTALIHTFTPAIGTGQENDYPLFLKETMVSDESFWVRVHAAEALILNNFPVDVRTAFSDRLNVEGPEKVGILRMLYHRSEEHTSELQSRENLVCRLLLEKKKQKKTTDKRPKETHQ